MKDLRGCCRLINLPTPMIKYVQKRDKWDILFHSCGTDVARVRYIVPTSSHAHDVARQALSGLLIRSFVPPEPVEVSIDGTGDSPDGHTSFSKKVSEKPFSVPNSLAATMTRGYAYRFVFRRELYFGSKAANFISSGNEFTVRITEPMLYVCIVPRFPVLPVGEKRSVEIRVARPSLPLTWLSNSGAGIGIASETAASVHGSTELPEAKNDNSGSQNP
ncbi:hypothetical protein C8R48DRAFT_676608 [Suillus tomentosus]|nr:hypothetical protein C8R48DRAFT_676608 [Suillus tomentosus]